MALPKIAPHGDAPRPARGATVITLPQQQMPLRITMQIGGVEPGTPEAAALMQRLRAFASKRKVGRKLGASAVVRAERNRR